MQRSLLRRILIFVSEREILADTITPILAFQALASHASACLLESVERGGRLSRYSFIGLDFTESRSFTSHKNVASDIRSYVQKHRPDGALASHGGSLIFASYDASAPFAGIATPTHTGVPDVFVAIPAVWLIFDHFTHQLRVWCCAENERAASARIDDCVARLYAEHPHELGTIRATTPVTASLSRDEYLERVDRAQRAICDGEVYQLQLGIRFQTMIEGDPFDIYRTIRSRNPSPYMFYLRTDFGIMLGASPEFLVRLEGRTARLRPLAGTRPRGSTDEEDLQIAEELLANEKERAEHVMLVDLGRNDIGAVCEFGTVHITELLQVERYSHVMHIVSEVNGILRDDCDGIDLFFAGFPAGTVTGTPKVRAMQLINEYEPVARGFYAGSIGRISFDGDFDSCISLRGMIVQDGKVSWQASAGIVADSDPSAEYDEVLHKTRIARSVLGVTYP